MALVAPKMAPFSPGRNSIFFSAGFHRHGALASVCDVAAGALLGGGGYLLAGGGVLLGGGGDLLGGGGALLGGGGALLRGTL